MPGNATRGYSGEQITDSFLEVRRRFFPSWHLLWRVFSVNGFACPLCGERMKVRAVVIWPPATTTILDCLSAARSRGPPALLR